jgi:hypothetical protein
MSPSKAKGRPARHNADPHNSEVPRQAMREKALLCRWMDGCATLVLVSPITHHHYRPLQRLAYWPLPCYLSPSHSQQSGACGDAADKALAELGAAGGGAGGAAPSRHRHRHVQRARAGWRCRGHWAGLCHASRRAPHPAARARWRHILILLLTLHGCTYHAAGAATATASVPLACMACRGSALHCTATVCVLARRGRRTVPVHMRNSCARTRRCCCCCCCC